MKITLSAIALSILAVPAQADEFTPALQGYLESQVVNWAHDEAIVNAINAQNEQTASYDQAMIDQLDTTWRAEVGASDTPTISPVLNNSTADFLRSQVEASGGMITEVFIMDMHGLNVAASDVTSDYWQGDEAKFSETYGRGADASHIADVEFDESTQTYQGQISLTIVDPATGQPIGAMTVGVDAEALL